MQNFPLYEATILANGAITANRTVGFDRAQNDGAKEAVFGVATSTAADGEALTVVTEGTVQVTSGGALSEGDKVACDASGRATLMALTGEYFGYVLPGESAAAAGVLVEILISRGTIDA